MQDFTHGSPPNIVRAPAPLCEMWSFNGHSALLHVKWQSHESNSGQLNPSSSALSAPRKCQRMNCLDGMEGLFRECSLEDSNSHTISHANKIMLKILQARRQQYVSWELPDVQAGFWRGRETKDQIADFCWIVGKARGVPEKHLFLLHWLH